MHQSEFESASRKIFQAHLQKNPPLCSLLALDRYKVKVLVPYLEIRDSEFFLPRPMCQLQHLHLVILKKKIIKGKVQIERIQFLVGFQIFKLSGYSSQLPPDFQIKRIQFSVTSKFSDLMDIVLSCLQISRLSGCSSQSPQDFQIERIQFSIASRFPD